MSHKKSSFELIQSQARAGRILERQREERELLASPSAQDFLAIVQTEHGTFSERCKPSETVCRNLDGSKFDWPADHWLTDAREFAKKIVADKKLDAASKKECAAFLDTLAEGAKHNHYVDPVAVETATNVIYHFASADFVLWFWSLFRIVDFCASKNRSGKHIYHNRAEFNFPPGVTPALEEAASVLRAANLASYIR